MFGTRRTLGGLTRSFMAFYGSMRATEDEAPNTKGWDGLLHGAVIGPAAGAGVAAVPASRNRGPKARDLGAELRKCLNIDFDDAGAIMALPGARTRSVPFCVMALTRLRCAVTAGSVTP